MPGPYSLMKILHLIDIPWWSGLSSYAFDCIKANLDSGHSVILACEKNSLSHKKAIEMRIRTFTTRGRGSLYALYNLFCIGKIVLLERPGTMIAHTGSTHWIALIWGKLFNIPVLRTRATSQPLRKSAVNKMIYMQSKKIVTASGKLKKECLALLSRDFTGITTIYPPVDIRGRSQEQGRSPISIGIVARLDPVKGYSGVLSAIKIVQSKLPGTEIRIAGSEENLKWHNILKEIIYYGLRNVYYYGFLPHSEIHDFMKKCSLGLIASTGSEEISRALLEWMSEGKPVVASKVGGIPELLKDAEGGFLFDPGDNEQMAKKILEILINPELARKMGAKNHETAEAKYSRDVFRSNWEKALA